MALFPRSVARLALCLAFVATAPALAATAPADAAAAGAQGLRAQYAAQRARLEDSPYGWPLALDSREYQRHLEGDAYLVVDHPFALVAASLGDAAHWCEILLLPFNTKHCESESGGARGAGTLTLFIGRRNETPVKDAYRLPFRFAVAARGPDYIRLTLRCDDGPLGTRDYRIALEATPLDGGRTFVKLGYRYGYGTLSRLAMQAYLNTLGSSKVGFSVEGRDGDGRPRLVRGMRGVMERNTMRYALALDAYLDSLGAPPEARVRKRLDDWFSATERYPRQLHEIDRDEYLAMKQREFARMHARGCCRTAGTF